MWNRVAVSSGKLPGARASTTSSEIDTCHCVRGGTSSPRADSHDEVASAPAWSPLPVSVIPSLFLRLSNVCIIVIILKEEGYSKQAEVKAVFLLSGGVDLPWKSWCRRWYLHPDE